MRQGEVKLCNLNFYRGEVKLRVFKLKYFCVLSPPQFLLQVVMCLSTPRMYPRSGYLLVSIRIVNAVINGVRRVKVSNTDKGKSISFKNCPINPETWEVKYPVSEVHIY